jgi:type II secretory pathway pseudopilin PulG
MTTRDRTILAVVCLAVALVAPWLLVVSPKRDQASKLQSQVSSAQSQLASLRSQEAAALAARRTFGSSYTSLVKLGQAVPTDDNTPSLIYELQSAASASRVQFKSFSFNAGSGGGSAASSGPSSQKSAGSLPPGATTGPAGFPIEPFTFTFQGNFFHLADFLGRLQRFVTVGNQHLSVSGRLMTLNAISLGPGSSGFPQVAATISATTFLLPASQGLLNGASPSGPAPTTTQTVSTPAAGSPPPPAAISTPVR